MPYIEKYRREVLTINPPIYTSGELTFVLYKACLTFLGDRPKFIDYAEVLGALEAAKLEFYRRKIAPYEDEKIKENGDIT